MYHISLIFEPFRNSSGGFELIFRNPSWVLDVVAVVTASWIVFILRFKDVRLSIQRLVQSSRAADNFILRKLV